MIDKPKILIVGGTGLLGQDLSWHFRQISQDDVVSLGSKQIDITSIDSIRATLEKYRPHTVLNAASYTNVDKAETERDAAYAINVQGAKNLAEACHESQLQLLHYSTDYVFDGSLKRAITEEDAPHPLNYYGETKWEGDQAVLKYPKNTVIRIQWLYGNSRNRFSWLKDAAVATPFSDQYGAPTWTMDVAKATGEILSRRLSGLYHFAYDDHTNWEGVFELVKKVWNLNVELNPVNSASKKLPAARPTYGVMNNLKLCQALGWPKLGSWKSSLEQYLTKTR